VLISGVHRNFFRGGWLHLEFFSGASTNSVEDRGHRERGSGGSSPPSQGFHSILQMNETHILIRFLRMYFPRNWEFGSALSKLRNLGVCGWGLNPPNAPQYVTGVNNYSIILRCLSNTNKILPCLYKSYRLNVSALQKPPSGQLQSLLYTTIYYIKWLQLAWWWLLESRNM
jgi:hypothetical protein